MIHYSYECTHDHFVKLAYSFKNEGELIWLSSGENLDRPSFLFLLFSSQIIINEIDPDPWQQLKDNLCFSSSEKDVPRYVGYCCYEMGCLQSVKLRIQSFKTPIPLACFSKATIVCKYLQNRLEIFIFDEDFNALDKPQQNLFNTLVKKKFWEGILEHLPVYQSAPLQMNLCSQSDSQESYVEKIKLAKRYIREGDIYQVNLSRSTFLHTTNDAFDIFYQLSNLNPTPFSALLNFHNFQIISASPECFLTYDGQRLETRPIKGTIQRGQTVQEDQILYQQLLNSEKEDAELMMICDLMRNDLGKISKIGSVQCEILKKVLKLSNVFHLESTITSIARKMHPVDLLCSAFPAGSISGCPKLRALEIIQEIEKRPRHIYCGAIGYFTTRGHFNFSVAIRTALLQNEKLEVQMGGAITIDSDLLAEYKETFYKGSPFFKVFQSQAEMNYSLPLQPESHYKFDPNQHLLHPGLKPSIQILDETILKR